MPIYEYRCASCGHELEALQKLADAPLTVCPACGKSALNKLVSAAGFQLKGSGWYVTDFRNSGAKPAAKDKKTEPDTAANGSAAATSDAKSTEVAKSDAKPAAAGSTETKPTTPSSASTKSDS